MGLPRSSALMDWASNSCYTGSPTTSASCHHTPPLQRRLVGTAQERIHHRVRAYFGRQVSGYVLQSLRPCLGCTFSLVVQTSLAVAAPRQTGRQTEPGRCTYFRSSGQVVVEPYAAAAAAENHKSIINSNSSVGISPGPETDFYDDSEFRIFAEIR